MAMVLLLPQFLLRQHLPLESLSLNFNNTCNTCKYRPSAEQFTSHPHKMRQPLTVAVGLSAMTSTLNTMLGVLYYTNWPVSNSMKQLQLYCLSQWSRPESCLFTKHSDQTLWILYMCMHGLSSIYRLYNTRASCPTFGPWPTSISILTAPWKKDKYKSPLTSVGHLLWISFILIHKTKFWFIHTWCIH